MENFENFVSSSTVRLPSYWRLENNHSYLNENEDDRESEDEFEKAYELLTRSEIKKLKKMKVKHSNSPCIICYEKYAKNDIIRRLPCKHFYHYKCLKQWFSFSNSCPMCRCNIKEMIDKNHQDCFCDTRTC